MRTLLCDDEPLAVARLTTLLAHFADVTIVGTAGNGLDALAQVKALSPDLVFLDVEMPGLDGFDVAEELARRVVHEGGTAPLIVFVTAFAHFAVEAFDAGPVDFLTKPVRLARLETALARARHEREQRRAVTRLADLSRQLDTLRAAPASKPRDSDHLWVHSRGERVRVPYDRVEMVRAEGEYIRLFVGGTSFLHRGTISGLASELDPAQFIRVHRSFIVRREQVASIRRKLGGAYVFCLATGQEVPVGRVYRRAALALLDRTE